MRVLKPHVAIIGAGTGISLASFRRFCAVAARRNSSRAPGSIGRKDRRERIGSLDGFKAKSSARRAKHKAADRGGRLQHDFTASVMGAI
jgi:hypothetical protein